MLASMGGPPVPAPKVALPRVLYRDARVIILKTPAARIMSLLARITEGSKGKGCDMY
jgi:hypothetical protein